VVLVRDLRRTGEDQPGLPSSALEQAIEKLTRRDFGRSLLQHNREFNGFIRGGVRSNGAMIQGRRNMRRRRLLTSATASARWKA